MNTPTQSITEQQAAMVEDMMEMYADGTSTGILKQTETVVDGGSVRGLKSFVDDIVLKWNNDYDMWCRVEDDLLMYTVEKRKLAQHYACAISAFNSDLKKIQSVLSTLQHHETPINSTNGDGG